MTRTQRVIQQALHLASVAAFVATLLASSHATAQSSTWRLSPYEIQMLVAVESVTAGDQEVAADVDTHVNERADASIGALWDMHIAAASPAETRLVADAIDGQAAAREALVEGIEGADKLLVAQIRETPRGVWARVAEYDAILMRWGRPVEAEVATLSQAPEAVFRLACQAFSPLAEFSISQGDPNLIELAFRGDQLPQRRGAPDWIRPDDILQPVLRQLDRDGAATAEGIRDVPWTYLLVGEAGDNPTAKFVSHTRRPLPSRRRGRVERLAVRLPRRSAPITLRAHAKADPARALVGYQVFIQDGEDAEREPAGATGPDGRLVIEPGEAPILMAYIKSGSQLVAKVPVAPGSVDEMDVPLLDETTRLNAEAKLGILREDLIDLVAQRKILIARIDAAIEAKNYDQAVRLITDLERLPARAIFDRQLRNLEQSSTSDVPMIQKRIDRIFADTRSVLAAFLNPSEIQGVKSRLANARKNEG
ncbi:hypothetical protein KOR34_05440 [Posidoniimonas corsicana]|uniref:Peptidylprolyl isomerase n=1 Tax=Posidoniimonas corsicana TaxID=1938618 RepID=A0A5C5VC99_9BACT|nr:hypothetical protein [Posidoniimonas corsicana]TWT35650.1 hypothetical protein KOR34_05440 [Posidoniimonas corsicana]